MEGLNTDILRTLAPSWTLAGDDMLLTVLQNTHQRILSRCQEVNTKLDEMTSSLDDASIHLQNVNNKFMSLSNRQFIERRVYEDDEDVSTQVQHNTESPKQSLLNEIEIIKNSLVILESKHETAEIIDESDSDSDMEISVVLKPRDIYSDRPLPYIIGSQQWKNKWHAGLITETSDTDSLPSKEQSNVEYSDSEVEEIQTDRHHDNTISESSSLQSEDRVQVQGRGPDRVPDRIGPQPTAAEIAANIASVMARTQPLIERPVTPPPPSPKDKVPVRPPVVYKPTQPLTSRVFPDEPPPLDDSHQYSSSSSQEDIFAEINKNKPYNQGFKVQSGITEDLFGKKEKEDVFGVPYDEGSSYFRDQPPSLKQKSLIKEQTESKSVEQSHNVAKDDIEENSAKRPIGGISLFGSNKNSDTIGAAILKRNIRKSSTSDESENDVPITNKKQTNLAAKSKNVDEIDNRKAEKDIFENLFAKSNSTSNKNPTNNIKEQKTIVNTEKKQNKDLFSENIFDDVDDIFSSDIKIPSKTDKPSLFDDDDDLFTDIAKSDANVSKTKDTKPQTVKTKLFDSDDELFSEIKTSKGVQEEKVTSKAAHPTVDDKNREKKSSNTAQTSAQAEQIVTKTAQPITTSNIVENIPKTKAISIFDSDSDEDIFNFNKSAPKTSIENSLLKPKSKAEEIKKFRSPSLFDDDELDELFVNVDNNNINKVDSQIDSSKVPVKDEFKIGKQAQKKKDLISNEIESRIKTSTDPLLSENDKEKSALNVERENSQSFETNIRSKVSDVSTDETAIYNPEAQNSKSVETLPTSNNESVTSDVNKLDETKVPENEIYLNAKMETTPSDKLNFKSTNDQTNIIHSDDSNKEKEMLLPKPEVPIFNEHILGDVEPPPFEPTKESIDHIDKETHITEDPIQSDVEEIPETPNYNEQIESIDEEGIVTPILEKEPKSPAFEDQMENIGKEIPPDVPIFDAIVTEPPIFEKAKEPKKSKNVNALFDDDSEDEALFFKKDDGISDEKPEVFSNAAHFGLFTDEPPPDDFENDLFGSKYNPDPIPKEPFVEHEPIFKNENIESNQEDQKSHVTDNLEEKVNLSNVLSSKTEVPKSELLPSQRLFENDSDEDIFSFNKASSSKKLQSSLFQYENNTNKKPDQISANTDTIDQQKSIFDNLDDHLFTNTNNAENTISDSKNVIKKDIETKKVGKLSTNLNINVQALVPGASPKKTKIEKVDTEPKIVKSEDSEPKLVKSISFEDEPDREVLDNNVSKQRAKIQVKRRPSSRKARHEAVRKSALDLDQNIEQDFEPNDKLDPKKIENESNINAKGSIDTILHDTKTLEANENSNKTEIPQSQNTNTDQQKEKCTKVVYVLNDEDIFTNPIKSDTVTDVTATTSKSEVIAKTEETTTKTTEKTTIVEANQTKVEDNATKVEENATKVKENATKVKENATKIEENATKKPTKKISLFDSDDDEPDSLFKTKSITKQTKNTKLFDSDSDDDLFSNKKKQNLKEKEKTTKKSLFDDDVEDDDLFGAKPKARLEKKPQSSTSKDKFEGKNEKSKTLFADPLSLFGDDDDD